MQLSSLNLYKHIQANNKQILHIATVGNSFTIKHVSKSYLVQYHTVKMCAVQAF